MMRRIFWLALIAAPLLGGCAQQKAPPPQAVVIGVRQDDHWRQIQRGVERGAEQARFPVDFYAPAQPDPKAQIAAIEDYLKRGIKGIAFATTEPAALTPVIQKAQADGVACITLDTDAPATGRVALVTAGDHAMGVTAGRALVEALSAGGQARGQMVIVSAATPEAQERLAGFNEVLSTESGITRLNTIEHQGSAESARGLALNAIMQYPGLSILFAADADSAVGCAGAVSQQGRKDQIKIVAIGETSQVMRLVGDGTIAVAVAPRLYQTGKQAVTLLWMLIHKGKAQALRSLPANQVLEVGADLIIASDLTDRRASFEEKGLPVDF